MLLGHMGFLCFGSEGSWRSARRCWHGSAGRDPPKLGFVPRDAFPCYDEPVNIEGDPEELLTTLLTPETGSPVEDGIEPELDA